LNRAVDQRIHQVEVPHAEDAEDVLASFALETADKELRDRFTTLRGLKFF